MKKTLILILLTTGLLASCVSKKKYVALETQLSNTQTTLQKTAIEKENLEKRFEIIEGRVAAYNAKINSLQESNNQKFERNDVTLMNNITKDNMRKTIAKVDPDVLQNAKTIEDSINIAVSYNLKKSITNKDDSDDVQIDIDKTVVMISISDKLLFNTGSYRVSDKANNLLQKLAEVINSEPSLEVMVEGHTDSRSISTSVLEDNWDLSVKRATSIVRLLESKYKVSPEKLIAAGRGSSIPLVENDNRDNMAKNRRTRIVIIPDLDKFFALLDSSETAAVNFKD
ncbi:MAG: cell envelope biogenesis protein OmpA [Bacteroidetes bacterium HGW-Bacteroidetes-2]|jgi:chemotaxis protein MotB|nr:MAG: cell envelope biogenesis protein OmpA [Bacteroidetes bacterium HGW-Bacteroidetes-2]